MPPYSNSRCVGDFTVVTSSNTSLYGYGDLSSRDVKPSRHIELNASSGVPEIKSTTQDLKITSAKGLDVTTVNGNIKFQPKSSAVTGGWDMSSETGGSGVLVAGSGGLSLTTTTAGDMTLSSSAKFSQNSGTTQSLSSVGDALFASSTANASVSGKK